MRGGDFRTNWIPRITLAVAAITATANGATVDTVLESRAAFEVVAGAYTDGTHTIKFQDSPDGSTWTDVAAANLKMPDDAPAGVVVGATLVIDGAGDGGQIYVVEYLGIQRYLRAVTTVAGTTTGALYGVNVVGGDRRYTGTSQFAN